MLAARAGADVVVATVALTSRPPPPPSAWLSAPRGARSAAGRGRSTSRRGRARRTAPATSRTAYTSTEFAPSRNAPSGTSEMKWLCPPSVERLGRRCDASVDSDRERLARRRGILGDVPFDQGRDEQRPRPHVGELSTDPGAGRRLARRRRRAVRRRPARAAPCAGRSGTASRGPGRTALRSAARSQARRMRPQRATSRPARSRC